MKLVSLKLKWPRYGNCNQILGALLGSGSEASLSSLICAEGVYIN